MRTIEKIADLADLAGQEIGVGEWMEVTQKMIDEFAGATGDHQWIHTDPERAKSDSPFRKTIAHGFLTLSIMGTLRATAFEIREKAKMGINYGLNRVRFAAPVISGSRVRGRFELAEFSKFPGGAQMIWKVTVEREGEEKPALVAEWITRSYF